MISWILWAMGIVFLLIGLAWAKKDFRSEIPIECFGISIGLFVSSVLTTIYDWIC